MAPMLTDIKVSTVLFHIFSGCISMWRTLPLRSFRSVRIARTSPAMSRTERASSLMDSIVRSSLSSLLCRLFTLSLFWARMTSRSATFLSKSVWFKSSHPLSFSRQCSPQSPICQIYGYSSLYCSSLDYLLICDFKHYVSPAEVKW